jgi:type IV secretory pathway TrbL component
MLAGGAARMTGRAAAGSIQAAASLTGRVGAAYEAGGPGGAARTLTAAPAARMAASGTAPVRDAYRRGAAQGYREAGPPPAPGTSDPGMDPGGGTPPGAPGWARSLARRQRLTQASLVAAGAMREGDRPAMSTGPELKDKS